MTLRRINTSIAGRVKKAKTNDVLIPLFEAVSNAIQSIEAAATNHGTIVVELLRGPRQLKIDTADRDRPITGFVITDPRRPDRSRGGFVRAELARAAAVHPFQCCQGRVGRGRRRARLVTRREGRMESGFAMLRATFEALFAKSHGGGQARRRGRLRR